MLLVLLVQTAAVWFMVGSVATMQVLNCPLLARVGRDAFVDYETAHNRRFGIVVVPGVVITVVTLVALLVAPPAGVGRVLPAVGVVVLVVIVVLTAVFQAPAHQRLARGFDADVLARLVRTNAWRALGWAVLGVLDLIMVGVAVG